MAFIFPTTLFTLTCLSALFSLLIFILALLNYGLFSVWIGCICALATLLYHAACCFFGYHRNTLAEATPDYSGLPQQHRHYTAPSVIGAFVLSAMWVIAFGLFVQITVGGPESLMVTERNAAWNHGIQVAECLAVAVEIITIGALAVTSAIAKSRIDVNKLAVVEEKFFDGALARGASQYRHKRKSSFVSGNEVPALPQPRPVHNQTYPPTQA